MQLWSYVRRVKKMNKCDFCTMSSLRGKCFWNSQVAREDDCKKAIKRMSEALEKEPEKKKKKF